MLQKFALAFKTKTIEFFAEEEDEEEDAAASDLDAVPEEIITGQRVVVLKPDPPSQPNTEDIISSMFTAISFFRVAYLQMQIAHSPFDLEAIRAADCAAVSHLHRISELKRAFLTNNPNPNPSLPFSADLDAQVQENQCLLRTFETVVNRMQADIDRMDAESVELKQRIWESEAENGRLERRLERACSSPEDRVESLLTVGVFNSVLKDSCRVAHRFVRSLCDLMMKSGWNLELVANCIYPGVCYDKLGHCRYAILSYVCLAMFESFDLDSFGCDGDGNWSNSEDSEFRRRNSLREFIEHSTLDPLELIDRDPSSDFARFCDTKYKNIIISGLKPSLFGNSDHCASVLENLRPSSSLYELFVNMASSMWMLHKLAWAYDPVMEIFQIARGADFSMIYMECVCQKSFDENLAYRDSRPKVGFTVFPGFRVGRTVIQCWVYLDRMMQIS